MDGRRNFQTAISLVLALLTVGMEGSISPSVSVSLQKIKTTMTSAKKDVGSRVDQISNYLASNRGSSEAQKLSSSIEGIGDAITSLTSDDPVEIVSGTLDMISAVFLDRIYLWSHCWCWGRRRWVNCSQRDGKGLAKVR